MLKWLVKRERKRQFKLGYTLDHDRTFSEGQPSHLLDEAVYYFRAGKFVKALALLQARVDLENHLAKLRRPKTPFV